MTVEKMTPDGNAAFAKDNTIPIEQAAQQFFSSRPTTSGESKSIDKFKRPGNPNGLMEAQTRDRHNSSNPRSGLRPSNILPGRPLSSN